MNATINILCQQQLRGCSFVLTFLVYHSLALPPPGQGKTFSTFLTDSFARPSLLRYPITPTNSHGTAHPQPSTSIQRSTKTEHKPPCSKLYGNSTDEDHVYAHTACVGFSSGSSVDKAWVTNCGVGRAIDG